MSEIILSAIVRSTSDEGADAVATAAIAATVFDSLGNTMCQQIHFNWH